jgi:hypothetical protein
VSLTPLSNALMGELNVATLGFSPAACIFFKTLRRLLPLLAPERYALMRELYKLTLGVTAP